MTRTPPPPAVRARPVAAARRGTALVLVLILTLGLAVLVLGALYMTSSATLLTKSYDREQDFKYAAEAGLALGKSRLNNDALALPDSGFGTLLQNAPLAGADGQAVPGLSVNVYVGASGSTTGQFGTFASVVAEARDVRGARFVRRLELTQESFAKFAYWSNRETNQGNGVIYFGSGDQIWGPVWSNDQIHVSSVGGATFHDEVGTVASTIDGVQYGTFMKGYKLQQSRIDLPTPRTLARLPGFAAAGGFSFNAPTNGDETSVRMRIEFVSLDLNADGDSTDADEGFLRVYTANPGQHTWLRGDYRSENCGDFHPVGGKPKFFPHAVHNVAWFPINANGVTDAGSTAHVNFNTGHRARTLDQIMTGAAEPGMPAPRCYLGGDPHLAPVERDVNAWNGNPRQRVGGDDTTFTVSGKNGGWSVYGGAAYAPLLARAAGGAAHRDAEELATLAPLWRGANAGTKGVVYVNGTVGISGTLRGRVTLYSNANIVILDDQRYATDPGGAGGRTACPDVLGLLADKSITVADNGPNTPPSSIQRNTDDTKDLYLHAVVMAMGQSFAVQNYDGGVTNVNDCEGTNNGRGCLYLTGGLIQDRRGAVGTSAGTGFIKRYSYDRCAAIRPPPYFPTTGRFLDNRYYELDPVKFDPASLYERLTPDQ